MHPVRDCVAAATPEAHEAALAAMALATAGPLDAADMLAWL